MAVFHALRQVLTFVITSEEENLHRRDENSRVDIGRCAIRRASPRKRYVEPVTLRRVTTLAELGFATPGPLLLVAPPDAVLAEAGRMHPRPSTASTIQTAEPSPRMAWWTEQRFIAPGTLSRLRWMLESANGEAWVIFDPSDEGLTREFVTAALAAARLGPSEFRILSTGEIAINARPGAPATLESEPRA